MTRALAPLGGTRRRAGSRRRRRLARPSTSTPCGAALASFDRLWLRWRGPFGLVWKQAVLPTEQQGGGDCPTSPACATRRSLFLQRDALPDGQAQRRAGQGREFEALKDYQPGMGRRMIDWKRSARHGKLLAREFRIEQNNNIVLAIDSGRLMCEPVDGVPKVDRAVTAALLSAFIALKGGDLVGLFSFDSRPRVASGAVRGSGSFSLIQKRAAEIDYSTEETNFTLALTTLRPGSTGARWSSSSPISSIRSAPS